MPTESDPHPYVDYFCSQRLAEGCNERTIDTYRYRIDRFIRETGLEDIGELATLHAVRWVTMMNARGLKSGAVNSMQRPVWSWFRWLHDQGFAPLDISTKVKLTRPRDVSGRMATVEIRDKLVKRALLEHENAYRNAAIVEMLWSTGMRRAELAALTMDDINLKAGTLNVLGKNQKRRHIAVGQRATAALHAYILHKRGKGPGPLFVARGGRQMSSSAVREVLRDLARLAGVEVSSHDFRRAAADWMLANGMGEINAMHQLGHESVLMVRRYARATEAQRAIAEFHRIDKKRSG